MMSHRIKPAAIILPAPADSNAASTLGVTGGWLCIGRRFWGSPTFGQKVDQLGSDVEDELSGADFG